MILFYVYTPEKSPNTTGVCHTVTLHDVHGGHI